MNAVVILLAISLLSCVRAVTWYQYEDGSCMGALTNSPFLGGKNPWTCGYGQCCLYGGAAYGGDVSYTPIKQLPCPSNDGDQCIQMNSCSGGGTNIWYLAVGCNAGWKVDP
jgi:hypothetical protein